MNHPGPAARNLKAVFLAGGLGTRISEETILRPKPMVEIGGRPILWHLMKLYAAHGIADFIVCLGYKGYMIKEYFANYFLHMSDVTIDLRKNAITVHQNLSEPWRVTLVDTGPETQTGGRLRRIKDYVKDGAFCMTYGDGLSDVDLAALIAFHGKSKALVTLTAVQAPSRFGALALNGPRVVEFREKVTGDAGWINGGFFVLEPKALDSIESDSTAWERGPMQSLARRGRLAAFRHKGFWHSMDTLRDKVFLDGLWNSGKAPWKTWR